MPPSPSSSDTAEAQALFKTVWDTITHTTPIEQLRLPHSIYWINGAPGAGKGTHAETIREQLGLKAPPIVISDLLQSPEAQACKNAGKLVGDAEVCLLLLRKLMEPTFAQGAMVDGFPRTLIQVEFLKRLHERLCELDKIETLFHIIVLFVDEEESIRRQLHRGREALAHNERVASSGEGTLFDVRPTDTDEAKARERYHVFREQTYEPLKTLSDRFPFCHIDTHASIAACRERILNAMRPQTP